MHNLTKEQIKDLSEQLDLGFQAFFHKTSDELLFVPDPNRFIDMDMSSWEEELNKLEEDFMDYIKIEGMDSNEKFQVMADFTEELDNKKLRDKLVSALNKHKPFREFKFVIDNAGEYRQMWFDFKNLRNIEWTEDQLVEVKKSIESQNASR